MYRKRARLPALKRNNYLFILPSILIATVAILFMQIDKIESTVKFYAHVVFIATFIIGWFLTFKNRHLKFFEYFMLCLVYVYHFITVLFDIIGSTNINGDQGVGTFIIWLPLIIIYTFFVLNNKQAAVASILLLVLTIAPGLYYYGELSAESLNSLIRIYLLTAIYSVILLLTFQLIRTDIEVQVMRRQLFLDPLTQIGNRHQIDEWVAESLESAELDSFSVLFMDIDFFKDINDQFGHQVGDDVLKRLTEVVQSAIEESHRFGRWGGAEFIVIADVEECEAFEIGESLRKMIESYDFEGVDRVTVSLGIAGFIEGDTMDSILNRADERLYISKSQGRNRVTGTQHLDRENLEENEQEWTKEP